MRQVFLDHQSTTPVLPEVWEAMRPYFTEVFGNPSSMHQLGLRAREALAQARSHVAALINAESAEDIIFTSGGTESANLAVKGAAYASQRRGNHVVVSATEHPAVLNSVEFLEQLGFTSTKVKVDFRGWIDPEAVRGALTNKSTLICVHHANHDIGTIESIREVGQIANEHGVPLFVDATASGGWLPIDVQAMGVSLLSLSPHRFYGPKGIGVLYRKRSSRIASLIHGGAQEGGRRAGTENVPGIVGAGVAAEMALRGLPERMAHTTRLQQRLWEGLHSQVACLKLNGPEPGPGRIGTNLNVSAEFIEGEGAMLMCDLHGIAVTSGTSCVSKSLRISHVLAAIGLPHTLAQASIIMSLGKDNSEADIDYVVETFAKIVNKLRRMSPLWDEFESGLVASALSPADRARAARAEVSGAAHGKSLPQSKSV